MSMIDFTSYISLASNVPLLYININNNNTENFNLNFKYVINMLETRGFEFWKLDQIMNAITF